MTHFPGAPPAAVIEFVVNDDSPADAGADKNCNHVPRASAGSQHVFAHGPGIDVVVKNHRGVQELAQLFGERILRPVQVWGSHDQSILPIDHSRGSHTDSFRLPDPFPNVEEKLFNGIRDALHHLIRSQFRLGRARAIGQNLSFGIECHDHHAGPAQIHSDHEFIDLCHCYPPSPSQ